MGLMLKALAFIVGVSLLGLGVGLIAMPLLIYSLWGFMFRRKRRYPSLEVRADQPDAKSRRIRKLTLLGVVAMIVSMVALTQGGRLSVVLLGGLGLALLFWDNFLGFLPARTVRPWRESVLLRSTFLPLVWVSIIEVKFLTRNPASALSVIDEPLIISIAGRPAIYFVGRVVALTHSDAMKKMIHRVQRVASVLHPVDAYLVPLDSADASAVLQRNLKAERVDGGKWKHSLQSLPFECLVLKPKGGFVESVGLFSNGAEAGSRATIPGHPTRLPSPPTVWEVVKALETRISLPDPDETTGYVASLCASSGEPLAQRFKEGTVSGEMVLIGSFAGRQVGLKATQLRALVRIYE